LDQELRQNGECQFAAPDQARIGRPCFHHFLLFNVLTNFFLSAIWNLKMQLRVYRLPFSGRRDIQYSN
jgi:hypothetical protein